MAGAVTLDDYQKYTDFLNAAPDSGNEKKETPSEKLRREAWALNSRCAKPMGVLPEKVKKTAHQLSSKVCAFCEDVSYTDPEDWERRRAKFEELVAKKTKEMDDCEAQIKQERADNPQAIYWDEAEKTYKKERRREDEGGPLREEAPMQSSSGAGDLETARARLKVDLSGLDDDAAELEVDLSKLNLTDSDLTTLLPEMPAVTALDLSGNRINDTGLQTLVATCVTRPELKLVKLQGNAFGELGRTMLAGLSALRPDLEVAVSTGPDPAPARVWTNTQS
jgi:hypothetical protein